MDCDTIFNCWCNDKKKIYDKIKDNIGENICLQSNDNNCLLSGLTKYNYLIRNQICKDCNYIKVFIKRDILMDEDELEVKYGNKNGDKILFNRYDCGNSDMIIDMSYIDINLSIYDEIYKYMNNKVLVNNIYYYNVKNKYLNLSIINIIISMISKYKKYPTYNHFINYYICREKIILLNMKYDIENIKDLLENVSLTNTIDNVLCLDINIISDILRQLVIFFLFLENFYFTHNMSCIEYLKIDVGLNNFSFMKKDIVSSIKLYVKPSECSSINIYNSKKNKWMRVSSNNLNEKRIFTNLIENWYVSWNDDISIDRYNRKIFMDSIDDFEKSKIIYYYLGKEADKFLFFRRKYGSMIMYKSFDILCFMVSLMVEKYIYKSVKNNIKINKIWENLWLREELNDIENEISLCDNNIFDNIFNIVRHYHLRVDALDYLSENLF